MNLRLGVNNIDEAGLPLTISDVIVALLDLGALVIALRVLVFP